MVQALTTYYAIVNIIAFFLYGNDKWRAKHHVWRIPERSLLGIAILGGALGAFLGMQVFRHKTKHFIFCFLVPVCLVIHCIFFYMIFRP